MRATSQTTIKADKVLPVPAERARDELAKIFASPDGHRAVLLSAGPGRGHHGVTKQVAATLAAPREHGSTYIFELHWWPVGFAAQAYPTLDARLAVTAMDDITSLLSILAMYAPPFGALGAAADRAAMSRVAEATVTSLIHRLATDITDAARPAVGV